MKIPFCEALIDQDRHIGNDPVPVGYKCMNRAQWITPGPNPRKICGDCKTINIAEPSRVTFRLDLEFDNIGVEQ